ncbi:MAG TPA: hypothetical protein VK009_01525 [Chloroflexota bacterium]|nr:hypothetical protein [Chloroflexota bacterium]
MNRIPAGSARKAVRRSARRTPPKPRAWRVTEQKPPPAWQRLLGPSLAVAGAVAVGFGLLSVTGVFGAAAPSPTPAPSVATSRQIVSSTLGGNTPTTTATPLPSTPVPAVGGFTPQPTPGLTIQAGPPVAVQQITPITAASPPPPRATPSSLPGSVVPASARPAAAGPTPPSSPSIADELRAINATATALTDRVAAQSGSATPGPAGTPRATVTETPIPTAAPPLVPQPQA